MNAANQDPFDPFSRASESWTHEREPFSFYGFEVVSPRGVEEVIMKLFGLQATIASGAQIQVYMDFDRTLSDAFSVSTWEASASALKDKRAESSHIERAGQLALQQDGLLTQKKEASWSYHELKRHVKNRTTDDELLEAATVIPLRVGARRLFHVFQLYPSFFPIIVSGGIGNTIDKILEIHNIQLPPNQILANRFVPYQPGQALVFPNRATIIGSGNKLDYIRARFPDTNVNTCHTIALGDSLTDAEMAFNGLAIRTAHPEGNNQAYLEQSAEAGFDLVLQQNGLLVVGELLEQLAEILHGSENR